MAVERMETAERGTARSAAKLHGRVVSALVKGLQDRSSATVAMPYSSGAASVARRYAEASKARLVVVCVPTVESAREALIAFRGTRRGTWHNALLVAEGDTEFGPADVDALALPVGTETSSTISAQAVREFLSAAPRARKLIVTTFALARLVGGALHRTGTVADVVACMEAHELHGRRWRDVSGVVSADVMPSRRRVYLRATDVEAAAWRLDDGDPDARTVSLDDTATFGPTVCSVSRSDAARCRLVTIPEVLAVTRDTVAQSDCAAESVVAALGAGSTRIASFQGTLAQARKLAKGLDGRPLPGGRAIRTCAIGRNAGAAERRAAAALLAAPDSTVVVACEVGSRIDVSAADCIVLNPLQSATEVVRFVGECSHVAQPKCGVRVVLPVPVEEELDFDTAVGGLSSRAIWMSLRALWAGDGAAARELLQVWLSERPGTPLQSVRPDVAREGSFTAWTLRPVDPTGQDWYRCLDVLRAWSDQHGHARPSWHVHADGVNLTRWVTCQGRLREYGMHTREQQRALALPGYAWNAWEIAWWQAAQEFSEFGTRDVQRASEAALWAALRETPAFDVNIPPAQRYETLAEFVVDTCARARAGTLPDYLERAADGLPGWRGDMLDPADASMFDALVEFALWKGHFNPPLGYLWDDDAPLGDWVENLRRRRVIKAIGPALDFALEYAQRKQAAAQPLSWRYTIPQRVQAGQREARAS